MTTTRRITPLHLVLVTAVIWSLITTTACSRYHSDDGTKNPRHRHRHRHDGTLVPRRNHEIDSSRHIQWPQQQQQDEDYEDSLNVEDEDDDNEDEDYDLERPRPSYERSHHPQSRSGQRSHHSKYEPRYPLRHHQSHYGTTWYRGDEETAERRRNSRWGGSTGTRGHPRLYRPRERTYHDDRRRMSSSGNNHSPRNYDFEDPEVDAEEEDEGGYGDRSSRRWRMNDSVDEDQDHRGAGPRRRPSRRWRPFEHHDTTLEPKGHRGRLDSRRNDWKPRTSVSPASSGVSSVAVQRNKDDDSVARRLKGVHRGGKRPGRGPMNDLDDDLDDQDFDDDFGEDGETKRADRRKEEEENEEEESIWNEAEDEDLDEDDDDFDNTNYYKTEDEPPYKTFDDIIKSLTSDDPTTSKPTVRRDYRNTGIEKYLKKDQFGNIYDSRNSSKTVSRNTSWGNSSNKWRFHPSKPDVGTYSNVLENGKFSNAIGDGAGWNKDSERKKVNEPMTKTKSLEQEYDEDYENNEKDEDVAKVAGLEHVTEMQADITNAEYADEENETETEDETSAPLVTSPPTTTTTTTTPRPVITTISSPIRDTQDRRDSRSYATSSNPQSNGLQQTVHSSHKWQSRDSAKDSKGNVQQNNRNGKSAEIKEALQHAIKVSREGSCQWPRARVIPVRDVYPSPSTTYIPHCAILHRCSDDTGCCRSEALTCVPKVSHRVELYFYTTSVGGASVVEKLSFYNHTECECKERNEYGSTNEKTSVTNDHRFTKHHIPATSPPQNIRRPPQRKPCKCPSEFTPRITLEGECQCNCFENDQNCIRTRRGKGYFSLRDRLCIQNEECATPVCEFGEYMRRQGKCPRKKDKFDEIARYPTNFHHRFRS